MSEIQKWISQVLTCKVSQKTTTKVSVRLWSHVKAWLRKDPFSSSLTRLLTRFSSSQAVGLRASFPCWLLAEGFPQSFPMCASLLGSSHKVTGFHQSEQAREDTQSHYSLISEAKSHRFCHIPFIRSESLSWAHLQGQRMTEGVNTRRWGSLDVKAIT